MLDWSSIDFGAVAQGLIYITLATLAGLGLRKGQSKPAERPSSSLEVQGALVDSSSVKQLAAAVEAINITLLTIHRDSETIGKARVETLKSMVAAVEALAKSVAHSNALTEREEEERERREREALERENNRLREMLKAQGDPMRRD